MLILINNSNVQSLVFFFLLNLQQLSFLILIRKEIVISCSRVMLLAHYRMLIKILFSGTSERFGLIEMETHHQPGDAFETSSTIY